MTIRRVLLVSTLCLSLSACETLGLDDMPSFNLFADDAPADISKQNDTQPALHVETSSLDTELDEMARISGVHYHSDIKRPTLPDQDVSEPVIDEPRPIDVADKTPIPVIEGSHSNEPPFNPPALVDKEVDISQPSPPIAMAKEPAQPEVTALMQQAGEGCPQIQILSSAKSIRYVESESNDLLARATFNTISGGCEFVPGGVEIDLDMRMSGTIMPKGRFEENVNEESFMTFPYFVSVISPSGQPIDKKISATAMRFRPVIDHLDHAEKITQFIPVGDVSTASDYKILVGFQLTKKQLSYNQNLAQKRPDNHRVSPDTSKAKRKSYNPLADE